MGGAFRLVLLGEEGRTTNVDGAAGWLCWEKPRMDPAGLQAGMWM